MKNPFGELIDLTFTAQRSGFSECQLTVAEKHLNPHHVVHGAVFYALADTGMGAALYPTMQQGELCATIEIKINYYKPVSSGVLTCRSELVNRGKRIANIESSIYAGDALVAKANGHYSIFTPGSTDLSGRKNGG